MIKNYLKIAFRNILKYKVCSFINVSGLAIGLACTLSIFIFIKDELSFDKFHDNLDHIYRLTTNFLHADGSINSRMATVSIPHAPAMSEYFPEIEYSVRLFRKDLIVKQGDLIENQEVILADKAFFKMFSFSLLKGDASTVLSGLNSLVLSESLKIKYFGHDDPIGKTLTLVINDRYHDFFVTGIAEDPPSNSSIQYQILINFECLRFCQDGWLLDDWISSTSKMEAYIKVKDKHAAEDILDTFPQFAKTYYYSAFVQLRQWRFKGENTDQDPLSFGLQPMSDVHFNPGLSETSNRKTIYILFGIAFMILSIAVINFVTLSVGNASKRFKEIGIRKVVGAEKKQICRQFWSEAILITIFAAIMSLGMIVVSLPIINQLTYKSFKFDDIVSLYNISGFIVFILLVGFFIGSYPALMMSSFKTIDILKGKLKLGGKNCFTQFLIIIQFAILVSLVISTTVMGRQIHYMINKDYGFDKENVLFIDARLIDRIEMETLIDRFSNRFQNDNRIQYVSASSGIFPHSWVNTSLKYEDKSASIMVDRVHHDYFKTLAIEFKEGRDFHPEIDIHSRNIVVNETFIRKLEIDEPIGKSIRIENNDFTIIGVVHSFHNRILKQEIRSAIYFTAPLSPLYRYNHLILKISPIDISNTIEMIRLFWKEMFPDKPFSYSFLDDKIAMQCKNENMWNNIVKCSAVFTILIACMGVFGLYLITVQRRTKEIGIRKIHGASVFNILRLLSTESFKWVIIANMLAWPVTWYAMRKWLESYAYKITMTPFTFIITAISMLLLVLCTTFYHIYKAARANPVESLRYE